MIRNQVQALFFPVGLLAFSLIAVTVLEFLLFANTMYLLLALPLLVITTILAVTNIFRQAGLWMALINSLLFMGVFAWVSNLNLNNAFWTAVGINAVVLIFIAILGMFLQARINRLSQQLENDKRIIEGLRVYDPETNLLNWDYATQRLEAELARSARRKQDLCLMLCQVGAVGRQDSDSDSIDQVVTRVGLLLFESFRREDIPFGGGRMGVILPDTNSEGALISIRRLVAKALNRSRISLHVGISHFPYDGATAEDLVAAANAALELSLSSGQPIVFYTQVRDGGMAKRQVPDFSIAPVPSRAKESRPVEVEIAPALPKPVTPAPVPEVVLPVVENIPQKPSYSTMIGFLGVKQVSKMLELEKVLRSQAGIEKVKLMKFENALLAYMVTHHIEELGTTLENIFSLPVTESVPPLKWIEVTVEADIATAPLASPVDAVATISAEEPSEMDKSAGKKKKSKNGGRSARVTRPDSVAFQRMVSLLGDMGDAPPDKPSLPAS